MGDKRDKEACDTKITTYVTLERISEVTKHK
jgi:hypothetical protein